jgi:hypothetical protein
VDDYAIVDTLVNADGDNVKMETGVMHFIWEVMSDYRGQRDLHFGEFVTVFQSVIVEIE